MKADDPRDDPGPIPPSLDRSKQPDHAEQLEKSKRATERESARSLKPEAAKREPKQKESEVSTNVETLKPKKPPVPPPAAGRIAKKALKVVEGGKTAKKAAPKTKVAKKAVTKVVPTRKPGVKSIGEIAREGIMAGLDNEAVLAKVKKVHPDGNTNTNNISWYRMDLRRKGILTDTAKGKEAKAALKAAKKTKKAK